MYYLSSILVPALLLLAAAGLIAWHVRSWRAAGRRSTEPRELDFRRRQFRRRMQTSAALGLLAAALLAGQWLLPWLHSRVFAVFYGLGVLGAVLWIALMALTDLMATKFHFSRQHQEYLVEQAKLRAQLRKIEEKQRAEGGGGNGRTKDEG
jgi:hypothetical protein